MDKRLDVFKSYKTHPWLSKSYNKLSQEDLDVCHKFIIEHDTLEKGLFEYAINRMFLDKAKPRRWTIIQELLTCCNSAIK